MPKRVIRGILVVILIVAAGAVGWMAGRPRVADQDSTVAGSGAISVAAAPVLLETIAETTEVTGVVTPMQTVTVISKVMGPVEWLIGEVGTSVRKGDVMARIDDADLRLQLKQAQAVHEQAQASLDRLRVGASDEERRQAEATVAQAEAGFRLAEESFERAQFLLEEGVIAKDAYDSVASQYEIARSQLEAARQMLAQVQRGALPEDLRAVEAQVKQAEVALELAEKQVREASITAPIDGQIAMLHTEVGSYLGTGTPVATLVYLDEVVVEAGVNDRLVNSLRPGDKVRVKIPALSDAMYDAEVLAVAPVVDQQTRLYPVRVRVPNPEHLIKPGMMARVEIVTAQHESVTTVPQAAVIHRSSGAVVFVVHPDGRVEERRVTLGISSGDRVHVTPVAQGELVAVSRQSLLADGVQVTIQREGL